MSKDLAKTNGSADSALAQVRENTGVMAQVASEVAMIPAVDKEFRYRLPRLGKVHLGVKTKNTSGKEYPKATEYFVLPDDLKSDPDLRTALEGLGENPDQPTRIPIMLPCNGLADNLRTSCDLYGSSRGLVCRTFDMASCRRVNPTTGELVECPCEGETCKPYTKGDCHWIHRLRVIIPDAAGIGVWQIDTTSPNNRAQLLSEMKQIKFMLGGRLAGVDLLLTLKPREFQIPMKGRDGKIEIRKTIAYLMHIESPMNLRNLQVAAKEAVAYEDTEVAEFDDRIDDAPVVVVANGEAEQIESADDDNDQAREDIKTLLHATFDNSKLHGPFLRGILQANKTLEDCTRPELDRLWQALVARGEAQAKEADAKPAPTAPETEEQPLPI